ncbi:MAG: cobalamin biosynthesis protein, partial [Pseudomonadota bacterium]
RFDDLLNLIPARLTGLLFTLQAPWWSKPVLPVLEAMRAEAPQHRSPNAGWPESALAQVLGVSLAGPRQYDAAVVEAPFINPQGRAPGAQDLQHGLMSYRWLIYTVVGLLAITALLQSF